MRNLGWVVVGVLGALVAFASTRCGPLEDGREGAAGRGVSEEELFQARGRPCASSDECPTPLICSTEQGACQPPPGCDPSREICVAVCYGTCVLPANPPPPQRCGESVCAPETYCCNPLQSLCVPNDSSCIF